MNTDYWINKWQKGETRFHQSQFHPLLVKFSDQLSKGTILVPLCGKTLDMHYLVSLGHSVIGVELSPIACKDFFTEVGITFTTKSFEYFTVFESENVTLWCGDFFKLPQDVWNKCTGIYDRAALIALPRELRTAYAAETSKRSPSKFQILLITLEYNQEAFSGPPFSVVLDEVSNIYDGFNIQKLYSENEEILPRENPNFKSVEIKESVFFLKK